MSKHINFSNGYKMPLVGLGTWQSTEKDIEDALEVALEAGYRHIDTAYMYQNEAAIGKVLTKWIDSGKIRREELFVVTKLPPIGMSPGLVSHFLKKSLENLQLSYVDLYLVHMPFGLQYVDDKTLFPVKDGQVQVDFNTDLEEVWKSMEVEADAGRVRSLGVSNFNGNQVARICKNAKHKPMNNQVELHAYLQQKSLRETCESLGVTVCAFAPVGSPGRKSVYNAAGLTFEPNGLLEDPVVKQIADKNGKTPGQILLRFLTIEGITVIPKSSNPRRIRDNIDIFDIGLTTEDVDALRKLDKGEAGRTFAFEAISGIEKHPEFPF